VHLVVLVAELLLGGLGELLCLRVLHLQLTPVR